MPSSFQLLNFRGLKDTSDPVAYVFQRSDFCLGLLWSEEICNLAKSKKIAFSFQGQLSDSWVEIDCQIDSSWRTRNGT